MKRLNTGELGGHPLTLNDLEVLQGAVREGNKEIIKSLIGSVPCILHGMFESYSVLGNWSNIFISSGAYWDGNDIVICFGGFVGFPNFSFPIVYLGVEEPVLETRVYKNGQTKNAYTEKRCFFSHIQSPGMVSLSSIGRLNNILKDKLGINSLSTQINGSGGLKDQIDDIEDDLNTHINSGGHNWLKITSKPIIKGMTANINNVSSNKQDFTFTHNLNTWNYTTLITVDHYNSSLFVNTFNGVTCFVYERRPNYFKVRVSFPNLASHSGSIAGGVTAMITARTY